MFRRILLILILSLPIVVFAQKKIQLFNHNDLSGWYAYEPDAGKLSDASKLFSIDQNMIRLYGPKAGYLMSEQSYANFKLTVEFRWNTDTTFVRKSNKKNSGLMYLVPVSTHDELWPKGIQFQIKEGATGDFILLKEVTLKVKGEKVGPGASIVSKRFADAAKPVGEWNTIVIIVKDGKITQELNGQVVNQGEHSSVKSGRILLQYEGYPIDFRKVELEEL